MRLVEPFSDSSNNSNKVSVAVGIRSRSKKAPTPHPLTNGIEGRHGTSQPGARGSEFYPSGYQQPSEVVHVSQYIVGVLVSMLQERGT